MKLFWKIYFAVVIPSLVVASLFTYVIATYELADEEEHTIETNMLASEFITREIEKSYVEFKWPFDSLARLSKRDDFLFWWVVRDDGTIHLANDTSFIGTRAYAYFPQVEQIPDSEKSFLDKKQSRGVFVKSFGEKEWSLWLGFSLKELALVQKKFILLSALLLVSTIGTLGIAVYFTVKYFTKPIKALAKGAERVGEGDLTYRAKIKTKDEIGKLAASFNAMAGKLEESHLKLKESHIQLEEKVKERVKDLNCLYGLSKLIEQPEIPLGAIFQEATSLIRNAYQYPDITCVRITFNGVKYQTDNFDKSELSQHAQIKVGGEKTGEIEVYYLGEEAESDESPFLQEERDMLDAVAEHLGRIAERKKAGEKLQLFRNLIDRSNDCIFVMKLKWGRFLDVNDKACESLGYTREELLTMSFKDIEESIRDESAWQRQTEKLKVKSDLVIQGRHKCKDATTFYAETSLKYVSQGKEEYIIAVSRDITERKQAEEALKKSEKKYRTLLENIPQRVFLKDKDSVYVSCNENYAGDLGIKPREIAGRTDYEFYPKELADKYRADDRKVIKSGKKLDIDEPFVQNGQEMIVHTVKTPVRDEQGNVSGVLGIFWDVTELKRAQEEIERLAKFPSENPNPVLRVAKDGSIIYANNGSEPLLNFWGCKTGELLPEEWRQKAADVFRTGSGKATELQCDSRMYSVLFSPIVDFGYVNVYALDITERKLAEEKLKQAAEEWRTTFASISDLVSIQDKDFKLLRVNKAFADAFKMKPEELIGKHCYEIIHGTKEPPACCPHKQSLDTKKPQSAEFFEPHLGIYVEASTSPIFDENGDIIASVHITKDITERKHAEEKQAGLLETVESINKELKDFAYIVSHDLKAPLRGIKTLADWIATDYADMFDEEGRERVNLLTGRVVRMHNLIDGILQYSRVGREKVKRVRVNLNELVSEVIEAIVPPENIEITIEEQLPVVECGETRIIQVFQNLLSNAIKYMDKPRGQIKIGCVQEDGFWKFSVSDNGPGIEKQHYERIFKIFQTLSPRDEFESTGVGLSVVKKIVELYGGKIWVESKPGEGSTFFFTLPKQESEVVDDAQLEAHIVS